MGEISNNKKELFENMPVSKAIFKLAMPTIIAMLVTIVYNLADTFFIGQTGDPIQVAAVSLTMPIFIILMALGNLFGIGGSTLISRSLGSGYTKRVKNISSFCFYGSIVFGLVSSAILLLFMDEVVKFVGASGENIPFVKSYLTYLGLGAPFLVISNSFAIIVRGEGAANKSMIGMMVGTVVNIVLDPIFILGFDMGVAGAAIATVIGNIASTLYYISYIKGKKSLLSISYKQFQFKDNILKEVFAIGVPGSINNILMSVANVIYNNFLATYGDSAIASMGIASKVMMMLVMVLLGLSMGTQPLFAYSFGSKNYKRLRQTIKLTIIYGVSVGLIVTTAFQLFAPSIIRIFIDDPEIITLGTEMLKIISLTGTIIPVILIIISIMQAIGKAVLALILSICRQGLVFIPTVIIANSLFGLDGIMWAQPIADTFSFGLSSFMLYMVFKKLPKIYEVNIEEGKAIT